MDPSTLARDLRLGVAELTSLATADLDALWRLVSTADEARDALLDVLPALVAVYTEASATLAADWYDEARAAAGVRGAFGATPVTATVAGGAESLARWAVAPLYQEASDWPRARTLVTGGVQARIADASRYTVATSSVRDPRAAGWQRVGDGSSCPFCLMLISRGTVYREATARFSSHDHCGCTAMPAWKGEALPVQPYTPSPRRVTAADRERVERYLDGL